ncbi:hypothetical protein SAMN02910456_02019 [Ruminococcaceae bacterium YRB3002]|nr:hypothetical protein SAMN02910456_02019 [Ruminococcaceae bacterium YRB3002]
MKKKKILAALLALSMMVTGVVACDELDEGYDDETEVTESSEDGDRSAANTASPLKMTVDKNSGDMTIARPKSAETPMADDGSWTIFVYICGSDLESGNGAATSDLQEMCSATASDQVRFVVQTGGASEWQNSYASNEQIGRFIVENNEVVELGTQPDASMGDAATLASFLQWGVKEYPGEKMGIVFWNHGGGSISGVCFDETHDADSLGIREIDSALYSVFESMTDRFEFIGFDACLMGTAETANILASYARYMVGSQETEPGSGWDYEAIGNFLADDPSSNGADLGKCICDSFYEACANAGEGDDVTLSVIDLDKMDSVVKAFNSFAKSMYEESENTTVLTSMIRGIEGADNFGGNNRSEGYTNMVDLGGLIEACGSYADGSDAISALNSAVVYNRTGTRHQGCSGLSLYYPLSVEGSTELGVFENVSISPFYASFVDRQDFSSSINYNADAQQGGDEGSSEASAEAYYDEQNGLYYFVQDGVQYCYEESQSQYYYYDESSDAWQEVPASDASSCDHSSQDYSNSNDDTGYSDDYWFDDNGTWSNECEYDYDDNSGCYRSRSVKNDHWDYADNYSQTGESPNITFLKEPAIGADGTYGFTLTPKSVRRASSVYALVYQIMDGESEAIMIGETYDINCDWDKGQFEDCFDGYWLSLPDGQNLSTTIVDMDDDYIIYSAPIMLNGVDTNLRMKQSLADNSIVVEGAWDGISDSGAASRLVRPINEGDKIVPVYMSMSLVDENAVDTEWMGGEYVVGSDFEIVYSLLDSADFLYAFCIDDIYNDYRMTDFVEFNVDDDGNVSYYEYE